MFSLKTSLIALALSATSAVSVHIEALGRRHHQISNRSENELALERRQSGKFTYYDPEPVACGGSSEYNGHTVAISVNIWNNGAHCGDTVTITINGKTTTAKVTDECMGCASNQLDLTPGLFQFFSGGPLLEVGEMYGSWDFGGSSGGGDSGNSGNNNDNGDDDKAAKEAAAKKKADEDKAAAEKKAADEKAAAEKKAAAESSASVASKSSASVASKSKASVASKSSASVVAAKSSASVASVSKASVAAVASASSVSAAAAKASAEAAAEAAQAEPTDAPQAVGGAVSGLDSSNGAPALRVSTPVVLFGALLGAAFVAL